MLTSEINNRLSKNNDSNISNINANSYYYKLIKRNNLSYANYRP